VYDVSVFSNKYLGVTLTSNLSWDKHVDNVAAKGNRTLGFIRRKNIGLGLIRCHSNDCAFDRNKKKIEI
jgi:hypothetical protein